MKCECGREISEDCPDCELCDLCLQSEMIAAWNELDEGLVMAVPMPEEQKNSERTTS